AAEGAEVAGGGARNLSLLERSIQFVRQVLDTVDVDHLLGATIEVEATIAVDVGQIAGAEPAVLSEGLSRGRGVVVVALEDDLAAELEAAALAGSGLRGTVEAHHAHLNT